jgi:IS30 family transposase
MHSIAISVPARLWKKKWKRYRSYDSRGRMRGKRPISERPPGAENRSRVGHLEGDTVIGAFGRHCILTLVDRKTAYVMTGTLFGRITAATNRRAAALIRNAQRRTLSLTVDNGTEFHGFKALEKATGAPIYFATPHHSRERGTHENTNGLIRQFLPKRTSMRTSRSATALGSLLLLTHVRGNGTTSSHLRSAMNGKPLTRRRCTSKLTLDGGLYRRALHYTRFMWAR